MEAPHPHPDRESFGEASLGAAQSENPPPDPEMLTDEDDERANRSEGEPGGTEED